MLLLVAVAIALLLAMVALRAPVAVTDVADRAATAGDAASYARITERMRSGEGYYPAAHQVLVADGYGTRSVFNWRTPAWPVILAVLPPGGGQAVLMALAVAALLLCYRVLRGAGAVAQAVSLVAVALSMGAVLAPEAAMFSEVVAGILILASIAAYGSGWRWLGFGAAVLALFLRELVVPYVLVCVLLSIRGRCWREFWAWCGGCVVYAAYLGWHWWMVLGQLGPQDRAYGGGWVALGGLDFVLATAQFNGMWALGPEWLPAVLLPVGLLGLWEWRNGRALATVCIYVAAFLVVGKPFNVYWGALYTPVLMLGLGWVWSALRTVARATS